MERASLVRRIGVDHEAIQDALCVRSVQLGCLLLEATSTSDDPLVDFPDHPFKRKRLKLFADASQNARDYTATLGTDRRLARSTGLASHRVISQLSLRSVVIAIDTFAVHEHEQLAVEHQTHQFIAQQTVIVGVTLDISVVVYPTSTAKLQNRIVQVRYAAASSLGTKTLVSSQTLAFTIDAHQAISEFAIDGVLRKT